MKAMLLWFVCIVAITVQPSNTLDPSKISQELLDAIRCVESNGDVCAIGDDGRSLGSYQIMFDYYEDAVEFSSALQTTGQEYKDLWGEGSKNYSESVIRAYMCRYATETRLGRNATYEDLARIHNGGPNGWNSPNTLGYWNKVSAALTSRCQGTAIHKDKCEPKCKPGQCCMLADGTYKCFCLQKLENGPAERYTRQPCEGTIPGIDLMFVLDSSGSTSQEDLNEQTCTASTAIEVETAAIKRTVERNTKVYFQYDVPSEGFTVKLEVDEGTVCICGSTSLACPDCSYSPSYDWKLMVTDYDELYINGDGIPRDEQQSITKRQAVETVNITVFVTIEGLESSNTFLLNTTYGDTAVTIPVPAVTSTEASTTVAPPTDTPTTMPPVVRPFRPNEFGIFIGDSPQVNDGRISISIKFSDLVQKATCSLIGKQTVHVNCTLGVAQYNLPLPDRYMYNRVVIKAILDDGSIKKMRRVIQIGPPHLCIVNFINDGVRVFSNGTAKLEFTSSGPTSTFYCRMDLGALLPCSKGQLYPDLKPGSHRIKVVPANCGYNKHNGVFKFSI